MNKDKRVQSSKNFVKGNISATLVLRLLRDLEFYVEHNGFEFAHSGLLHMMKQGRIEAKQLKQERQKPDFIVVREKSTESEAVRFELEVKFRANAQIELREIENYAPDVRLILVDKKGFWSATCGQVIDQMGQAKQITFSSLKQLEEDEFFKCNAEQKALVLEYKKLLADFYADDRNHSLPSKMVKKLRKVFPENHGKLWVNEDREKLKEEYYHLRILRAYAETIEQLSVQFDRTQKSIVEELKRLQIFDDES